MEYSVYDLIRILLKKWYVIAITVCLIAGLSTVTAKKSYEQVVRQYEEYTSEVVDTGVDVGALTVSYQYGYRMTDLSKYTNEAKQKAAFYADFQEAFQSDTAVAAFDLNGYVEQAYEKFQQEAAALITDTQVMRKTQSDMDAFQYREPPTVNAEKKIIASTGALTISNHLTVELLGSERFRITVAGLEEQVSRQIVDAYLKNLVEVGLVDHSMEINVSENSAIFALTPKPLTDTAVFAQTIMKKPSAAPTIAKTVGTAAVAAFALSCFGILLVTFIRDTRPSKKRTASGET